MEEKFNCAYTDIVDINTLKENPDNTNEHPVKQIKMLAEIIKYQGQRSPIVVSKRSGYITKGHGRLLALRQLGWQKVAVDFQDYDSEEQEYADMNADNNISKYAEFNAVKLINKLPDLKIPKIELLGLEKLPTIKNTTEEKTEIEFTEELLEEHNYIVLYFDNSVDWLQVESLFDLKSVQALNSKENYKKIGIGRVLKGSEALEMLRKKFGGQ